MKENIPGYKHFQPYDESWSSIEKRAGQIIDRNNPVGGERIGILKQIIGFIDLTTLEGTDNDASIREICGLARQTQQMKEVPTVPAVCVYPSLIGQAVESLKGSGVKVASVAGGFPSGQTFPDVKVAEIERAVSSGASEVDTVISRGTLLQGDYMDVYDELTKQRKAAGDAHLKVILETCELPEVSQVRDAAAIAMLAGADFIKTSTGKGKTGATIPAFLIMAETIREFYQRTGKKVGIKAAGGIRTDEDVIPYYLIVREILGEDWLIPDYFRIGASSLLKFLLNVMEQD